MKSALRQYGALAARQLLATGVRVNYWDLGNEVDWGVAGIAVQGLDPTGYSPPDAVDPAIGQMTAAGRRDPRGGRVRGIAAGTFIAGQIDAGRLGSRPAPPVVGPRASSADAVPGTGHGRCEAVGRVSPQKRPPGWRSCAAAPPPSRGTPPGRRRRRAAAG